MAGNNQMRWIKNWQTRNNDDVLILDTKHLFVLFENLIIPDLVPLCCYNNPPLVWECFLLDSGMWWSGFVHSAARTLMRSGTDVEHEGLGCSECSRSSLRSELCAGHSSSSTPILANHIIMVLALLMGHWHAGTCMGPLVPLKIKCISLPQHIKTF